MSEAPEKQEVRREWVPDLVIYHDKCADGIVAAWACWKRWGDGPEYRAANYGHQPPSDVAGKHILIVDFFWPADQLREIVVGGAASIVILDHHKTAQAELEPFEVYRSHPERFTLKTVALMVADLQRGGYPPILALFDMDRSGARMAWNFAHPGELAPRLVRLAERYDLWRFKPGTGDAAESLHLDIQSGPMTISAMAGLDLEFRAGDDPLVRGWAVYHWRTKLVEEIAGRAHLRTVAGVEGVISVECPYSLVSAVGHYLLDKHPAAPFAAMSVTGEKSVTWSLRSHDDRADVSEVAKRMGGGGHRNAAGFRVDLSPGAGNMVDRMVDFAALRDLIATTAADLSNDNPAWTAGCLADALIKKGVPHDQPIILEGQMPSEQEQGVELLPCPFCKGMAKWVEDTGAFDEPFGLIVDHADDCFLGFRMMAEWSDIIAAWNTRATIPDKALMPEAAEPVAWMYTRPEQHKDAPPVFQRDRASNRDATGWTETPLFTTPTPVEPVPEAAVDHRPIMLQIAEADDTHRMWERRWHALVALAYHDTNFVDTNGRWTLSDFINYAGEVCGFSTTPTPVEEPEKGAVGTSWKNIHPDLSDAIHSILLNRACLAGTRAESVRKAIMDHVTTAFSRALAATNAGQVEAVPYVVENADGAFVASFATKLLADFFIDDGNGCYRYREQSA